MRLHYHSACRGRGVLHRQASAPTLQVGNVSTNAITPVIVPEKMKINYERDVAAVTNLIDVPAFLVVTTTNFAIKDIKELIDYAEKNPGKLRYGTVGVGSYPHYDF